MCTFVRAAESRYSTPDERPIQIINKADEVAVISYFSASQNIYYYALPLTARIAPTTHQPNRPRFNPSRVIMKTPHELSRFGKPNTARQDRPWHQRPSRFLIRRQRDYSLQTDSRPPTPSIPTSLPSPLAHPTSPSSPVPPSKNHPTSPLLSSAHRPNHPNRLLSPSPPPFNPAEPRTNRPSRLPRSLDPTSNSRIRSPTHSYRHLSSPRLPTPPPRR